MDMKGVLFGHSFVVSLRDHLHHMTRCQLSPVQITNTLRMNDIVDSLHLTGIRGMKIMDPHFILPLSEINSTEPNFIILEAGTNDLDDHEPEEIAKRLIQLAKELLNAGKIKIVTICSLLRRESTMSKDPQKTYKVNKLLKEACAKYVLIRYHHHEGFGTPITKWTKDGIHPNTYSGRKNYKRSIRTAVFRTVNSINKLA